MFKPDFSKPAMKKFFLLHTEKLILVTCIILLGAFFWMGFQVKPFAEKTPDQLSKMADDADRYILSDTSWDSIKELRKGNGTVKQDIEKAVASVKPEAYVNVPFTGTVAKTKDKRTDPIILPVIEPTVEQFTAPVLISMTSFTDQIAAFPPAGDPTSAGSAGRGGLGGGRGGLGGVGGLGGLGGLGGGDDEEDDEEPEDEEDEGGLGAGRGGRGGLGGLGGAGLGGSTTAPGEDLPVLDIGTQMLEVNVDTFPALRPVAHSIPAATTKPILRNIVVVTGLVDYKQMWNSYDKSFSSGIGYFADRDKPIFQYLQVERMEVGADGKDGKWVDWSENVSFLVPRRFPEMHRMPKAMYSTAPDIVAPENFDPLLTGPIPAAVMVDYRPYVLHPKLADKTRHFPEMTVETESEEVDLDAVFGKDDSKEGDLFGAPGGSRPGLGGVGSPGGLGTPGLGGGPGAGGIGSRKPSGSRGGAPGEDVKQTRSGSDFTDYWKALEARKPASDYKLVRFFDIQVEEGVNYKYRMRVWVGDPNNDDPEGKFAMMQGGSAPSGLGGQGGFGSDPDADEDEEEDEEDGDEDEFGTSQSSGPQVKIAITSPMKHPAVRKRLNRAREETDPKDPSKKTYYVSEIRSQDENGEPVYEEVTVPADRSYLRFARPSTWSAEVDVKVTSTKGQVAAGQVETPKRIRFNVDGQTKEFPGTEPAAEVAASVWDWDLGTAVTSKRKVFRGEALDFYAPSYILHPVTWRVHVAKNESKTAEGEDKYLVPIETGTVVVDAISGDELPLPSSEKMRHHMASEVLVMNDQGEFHVQNDLTDRTTYRNLLFLADELQTVGGERARRKAKRDEENRDRRGGLGGAGGLGGLGGDDDDN